MARLLTRGMSGADVRDLQTKLNAQPSALPALVVDGIFGPRTQQRLVEFQGNSGLKADGIAGPLTLAALSRSVPPGRDFDEYQLLYQFASSQLSSLQGETDLGVAFFRRQKPLLDSIARGGFRVPVSSLVPGRGLVASSTTNILANPAAVAIPVAAILVILLFMAALALIMAQHTNQSAQEIARLEREFERRLMELNQKLQIAPFEAAAMIAVMMTTIEKIIRDRVKDLERMIERCRQLAGPGQIANCLPLFTKVHLQIQHILSQALMQGFETELRRRQLVIGLTRSWGFLLVLISDWAKCMGCNFLQFF
jgi:hypothetical protein